MVENGSVFSAASWKAWLLGQPLQPHESAAVLIQLAMDGERGNRAFESTRERDCYYLRRKYQMEIRIASWFMLVLMFLERPLWTHRHDNWDDSAAFPRSDLPLLDDDVTLPWYFVALCIIGWGVALEAGYEIFGMQGGAHDREGAWRVFGLPIKVLRGRKTPRLLFVVMLVVWIVSMVQVLAGLFHLGNGARPFWVAPSITLFMILGERSGSRRSSYLLRILPKFSGMFVVIALFIAITTTMAFIFFHPGSTEKETYFPDFDSGMWTMVMILTSSNWPLPMVPAVQTRRYAFFYFMLFVIIGSWGLLNIINGVIFSLIVSQRDRAKQLAADDLRQNVFHAFETMDEDCDGRISIRDVKLLLKESKNRFPDIKRIPYLSPLMRMGRQIYDYFMLNVCTKKPVAVNDVSVHLLSNASESRAVSRVGVFSQSVAVFSSNVLKHMRLIADAIDDTEYDILIENLLKYTPPENIRASPDGIPDNRTINYMLFRDVPQRCLSRDAMKLVEEARRRMDPSNVFSFDDVSNRRELVLTKKYLRFVDTKAFDVCSDAIIGLCAFTYLGGEKNMALFSCIVVFHVLELILRLFAKGWARFIDSYRNTIDAGITCLLTCVAIYGYVAHAEKNCRFSGCETYYRALLLFRLILLPRNLSIFTRINEERKVLKLALRYGAAGAYDVLYLVVVMLCVASAFCEFGVSMFGGSIRTFGDTGAEIANSSYGTYGYWSLNFNDFASGMGTLFVLLHVNNMHVICSGFEAALDSYVPRLFFLAWYSIAVLLMLNFIPAFIVRSFYDFYLESRQLKAQRNIKAYRTQVEEERALSKERALSNDCRSEPIVDTTDEAFARPKKGAEGRSDSAALEKGTIFKPLGSLFVRLMASNPLNLRYLQRLDDASSVADSASARSSRVDSSRVELEAEEAVPFGSQNAPKSSASPTWAPLAAVLNWIRLERKGISRVEIACVLIQHARRGIPPVLFSTRFAYRCFKLRLRLSSFFRVVSWCLVFSRFLARPAWTYGRANWSDVNVYPQTNVYLINDQWDSLLSGSLMFILVLALGLEVIYHWDETVVTHADQLNNYVQITEEQDVEECDKVFVAHAAMAETVIKDGLKPIDSNIGSPLEAQPEIDVSTRSASGFLRDGRASAASVEFQRQQGSRKSRFSSVSSVTGMISANSMTPLMLRVTMFVLLFAAFLIIAVSSSDDIIVSAIMFAFAPICVLWFDTYAYRKMKNLVFVLPSFLIALTLLLMLILGLGLFAKVVYEFDESGRDDGGNEGYFGTFGEGMWTIFLIITSSSYPSQMIPSYEKNREYILFFFVTVCIGSFLFVNLILLVIFAQFEKGRRLKLRRDEFYRYFNLKLAFEILDKSENGTLDYEQVHAVLSELYQSFADFRKYGVPSATKQRILVSAMDLDGTGSITPYEFNMIIDISRIQLRKQVHPHLFDLIYPGTTRTSWFRKLTEVVSSRWFDLGIDVILLTCVLVELFAGSSLHAVVKSKSRTNLGMLALVLISESIAKGVVYGKKYWTSRLMRAEFLLAVLLTGALILDVMVVDIETVTFIVVARIFGLIRLCLSLRNVNNFAPNLAFREIGGITAELVLSLGSLMAVLLCVMFFFCGVGVGLFGGEINKDPNRTEYQELVGTRYDINDYWPFNFNDYASGFMTMLVMLHVSDFDIICEAFSVVTSKASRFFFVAWYTIGVLLMLSTVKAFFMRAFVEKLQFLLDRRHAVSGPSANRKVAIAPTAATMGASLKASLADAGKNGSVSQDQGGDGHNAERAGDDDDVAVDFPSDSTVASGATATTTGDMSARPTQLYKASLRRLKFLTEEEKSIVEARLNALTLA